MSRVVKRKMPEKQPYHEYGLVTQILGGGKFMFKVNFKNVEMGGVLRGKFEKGSRKSQNIVKKGSIILVALDNDGGADIEYVYNDDEYKILKKSGELFFENEDEERGRSKDIEDDIGFDFDEL